MKYNILLLLFTITADFLIGYNDKYQRMDVNDIVEDTNKIHNYISSNFELLKTSSPNPLFPIKINYKSKNNILTICGYLPVDCFALEENDRYCFFFVLHSDSGLIDKISNKYGNQSIESDVQVNGGSNSSHIWNAKTVNIYLTGFYSFDRSEKYKNCSFIAIGNMEFRELLPWKSKGK